MGKMRSETVSHIGTSAPPSRTIINRVDPLNLLRVYATLVVFVAHTNIFSNGLVWLGKRVFFMNAPAWAAMWIFYTLSGYLAGKSFLHQKNAFSPSAIGGYYYKKALRVWFPTMIFIFLTCITAFPDFLPTNPFVIKNFFLCIYGSTWNNPGVDGVGATWFVFTLMWLYFSAPLWCFLANRIKLARFMEGRSGVRTIFYFAAMVICLAAGEVWRQYCALNGLDWFHYVYTPPYANISMFASGIFFAYFMEDIRPKKGKRFLKPLAGLGLCGIMLLLAYMLYAYGVAGLTEGFWDRIWTFYHNSAPGVLCVLTLLYVYAFDQNGSVGYLPPTLTAIVHNPCRMIDAFAGISFEFYLIHSLILNRISPYLKVESPVREWIYIAGAAFLISTIIAAFFSKMLEKVYSDCHMKNPVEWARHRPMEAGFVYFFLILIMAVIYFITLL